MTQLGESNYVLILKASKKFCKLVPSVVREGVSQASNRCNFDVRFRRRPDDKTFFPDALKKEKRNSILKQKNLL